ncbi:NAD(P)-binding domain-containing protein [Pyramidobacter sp. YE332]|uniref:NAD(P)-dependent oxidoreductase n=1 Tax=Pyramidobacter sp. YE332 TaxID=3068894 RepID=UPI0031BA7FA0
MKRRDSDDFEEDRFVGLGVMGRAMAANLMKAGFELTVYNRTKASAETLLASGAAWADSPAAVMRAAEAVITVVGYPRDVEQVYFGEKGLFAGFALGKLVIDMTPRRRCWPRKSAPKRGSWAARRSTRPFPAAT